MVTTTGDIRAEARADRAASEARAQADRAAFQEEFRRFRSEARADRETFETHVTGSTRDHAALSGIVEQMRTARNDRESRCAPDRKGVAS